MNKIQEMRNQAMSDYEHFYAHDLAEEIHARYGALQSVMLAEIALQLAKQNEELVKIAKSLDQLVEFKAIS